VKRALLASLLAALLLSGCASVSDGIGGSLRDRNPPRDPYITQHRDSLSPDYNRSYSFPVDAGAKLVNVTISLDTRSAGLLPGEKNPATASVVLLDPLGAVIGGARLDAQQPTATLRLARAEPGTYFVQVAGRGASIASQGAELSTDYVLAIEVDYA
jgi:hypothetical protein